MMAKRVGSILSSLSWTNKPCYSWSLYVPVSYCQPSTLLAPFFSLDAVYYSLHSLFRLCRHRVYVWLNISTLPLYWLMHFTSAFTSACVFYSCVSAYWKSFYCLRTVVCRCVTWPTRLLELVDSEWDEVMLVHTLTHRVCLFISHLSWSRLYRVSFDIHLSLSFIGLLLVCFNTSPLLIFIGRH